MIPAALGHGFRLLDPLSQAGSTGIRARDLADRTGLGLRMVYRYLGALRAIGAVEVVPGNPGHYRVGQAIHSLSKESSDQFRFLRAAPELAKRAAIEVSRSVHITAFDAGCSRTIANHYFQAEPRIPHRVGTRRPAHLTASGKLFLAFSSGALETYLTRPLHSRTPSSICSADELERQCLMIRDRKWSLDKQEHTAGIQCLAVPVFSDDKRILGSLSIIGEAKKTSNYQLASLARRLSEAGECYRDLSTTAAN